MKNSKLSLEIISVAKKGGKKQKIFYTVVIAIVLTSTSSFAFQDRTVGRYTKYGLIAGGI